MKPNSEVIEKLKKILTLANNKGATEGEVMAAMARAKEIAMKHSIDLGGIDLNGKDDEKTPGMEISKGDVQTRSKNPQKYHRWICSVLQEVLGVSIVRCWNRYVFIGESTDVAMAQVLFPWLEDVFYSTYNKGANAGHYGRTAAAKNACYWGLYQGIVEANKRAEEQLSTEDRSKWALVVVNKEALVQARVAQEFPVLKQARRSKLSVDNAAMRHGYSEGRKLKLNQVSGGASAKQIG